MYEYAATAIAPRRFLTVVPSGSIFPPLANFDDKKIADSQSAPQIIPMAPASGAANPNAMAPTNVINIPSCAAAPSNISFGLEINDEKSLIAPIPRKIRGG